MSPSSERPNADQPRPMTWLAPSGSTAAPTPPTMRARTALTRPARPAMIPITIAPVLIPPLTSPRSADFTSFVTMFHLLFFSLLGQVAFDQPSEVGHGFAARPQLLQRRGLEEPYGVALTFEELDEDSLGQRVGAEDGYGGAMLLVMVSHVPVSSLPHRGFLRSLSCLNRRGPGLR